VTGMLGQNILSAAEFLVDLAENVSYYCTKVVGNTGNTLETLAMLMCELGEASLALHPPLNSITHTPLYSSIHFFRNTHCLLQVYTVPKDVYILLLINNCRRSALVKMYAKNQFILRGAKHQLLANIRI
jgi:hypothetical protein